MNRHLITDLETTHSYTDIEAEEGKSLDVGFEIYPVQDFSVGLNLYQIDMENEISWNGSTWRNENLDDTRHRGLEMFTEVWTGRNL